MKVAYLIGSLNRGGAETLLLDIFRKVNHASFDMMIIHRKGGMYEKEFETVTPNCYRIAPRRWRLFSYLGQLRKHLLDEHVTVIHAFYRLEVIYVWLATIGLRIPIVITFHGYMGSECGWRMSLMYRMVMRMADKLCFVSGEQMKAYQTRYGTIVRKKGVVVYNGIDFTKLNQENEGVREYGSERKLRLCMVGNFNSVRSQSVIVQALHRLKVKSEKLKDNFDFYFIGRRYKGEECYFDECVKYCKEHGLDNVQFLGQRNDVPEILKSVDGFVYSSNNDTFGIAVIEAIAAGLPIVVNDHPVMKEVCGETNDGIRYYKTGDAEDAAKAITDMIENMADSRAAAMTNAVVVRNKYSIEKHLENLFTIYSHL